MSIPMNQLVSRFMSGQVVGLSGFATSFDYEDDSGETDFDSHFFPDRANPLAYEQSILDLQDMQRRQKSFKKAASTAAKSDNSGNGSVVSEPKPGDNGSTAKGEVTT